MTDPTFRQRARQVLDACYMGGRSGLAPSMVEAQLDTLMMSLLLLTYGELSGRPNPADLVEGAGADGGVRGGELDPPAGRDE